MEYGPHRPLGLAAVFAESVYRGLIPMSAILNVDDIETMADEWHGPTHQALIPAALLLALYQHDPQLIADWFEVDKVNAWHFKQDLGEVSMERPWHFVAKEVDGDITSSPR